MPAMTKVDLLTVDQVVEALPVKKTARWVREFLRKTPCTPAGLPLYRSAGRDKLVYLDRLIEALPCPSSSSRPAKAKARTGRSGGPISGSMWTEAQELTGVRLQPSECESSKDGSSVVSFPKSRQRKQVQPS
jgi:hypothetical protein